jgi:hypothetical protein
MPRNWPVSLKSRNYVSSNNAGRDTPWRPKQKLLIPITTYILAMKVRVQMLKRKRLTSCIRVCVYYLLASEEIIIVQAGPHTAPLWWIILAYFVWPKTEKDNKTLSFTLDRSDLWTKDDSSPCCLHRLSPAQYHRPNSRRGRGRMRQRRDDDHPTTI